jgi:hypothetical protein
MSSTRAAIGFLLSFLVTVRVHAQPAAPARAPQYDTQTVRALLNEALARGQYVSAAERSSLLAAIGRSQVAARDYADAGRTLALIDDDESPAQVLRDLGETDEYAGLERATLARRLTCAWFEAAQSDSALAAVWAMPPSVRREWELAHVALVTARGGRNPLHTHTGPPSDPPVNWRRALELANRITLADARLDALLGIASVIPDTGTGRPLLVQAYDAARAITLGDPDRQRSRDAMLAVFALRLDRPDDARALFARLSNRDDMKYVLASASTRLRAAVLVREWSPGVILAGRAIRDSAARSVYLTGLWTALQQSGGRAFADSLLPESTASAEHPRNLRAIMDSATTADTSPATLAKRAFAPGDYAGVRAAVARVPLDDRLALRADVWLNLAWDIYPVRTDTALAYLLEAGTALLAAPRDSGAFDQRARAIAYRQFWLGADAEGITTLNLVRDPRSASYEVSQWGSSTLSHFTATDLRGYADRIRNPVLRDMALAHIVVARLVGSNVSASNVRWGRALADSIQTPELRQQAQGAVAHELARRGDSTEARRRLLALLRDAERGHAPDPVVHDLLGELVGAGGLREALGWARTPSAQATRARRLLWIANELTGLIDTRENRSMSFSNGTDWCRDGF